MIDIHIQQKLREQYNPDGSQLRSLQLRIFDILKEFDAICKKYNIPYWLDSGTLLGAVRHGGFIPWDDDIDVCVLKQDQKRLRHAMQKELNPMLKYVDEKAYKPYPRKWARIVRNIEGEDPCKNTVWLDIFIMEYGDKDLYNIVNKTYGKCYRRHTGIIKENKWKSLVVSCLYPLSWVFMQCVRYYGRCFRRETIIFDYGCVFSSIRKSKDVFPLSNVEFENETFNAPHNYDGYLQGIYGDYMKIPSEQLRVSHNVCN